MNHKTQENNMEYKYSTINEVNHFEFGEAVVGDIQLTERMFHLVLDNVKSVRKIPATATSG